MKPFLLGAAFGALLVVPFLAQAQPAPRAPDPADPHAAVPAVEYRSAFDGAAGAPAQHAATPDKLWRQANAAVTGPAGPAGHAGAHAKAAAPSPAAAHGHEHGARVAR